ncbi:hypothetical protein [Paenibacillus tuaregi]|uniref:hypothetical protein n=1 Tax=Paenibacillus tuaregi TaxID=1816681 RepID=UPI000A6FF610|nr:hypothetical protein [Paenibacillus tuaregi]
MNMNKLIIVMLSAALLLAACGKAESRQHDGQQATPAGSHADDSQKAEGGHDMEHGEHKESGIGEQSANIEVDWRFSPEQPQASTNAVVSLKVMDGQGKPIQSFDLNHEKKMHLIMVSKDLSYFDHIHPEYKGDGQFEVETSFPAGGDYKLVADFIPTGQSAATITTWVKVQGKAFPQAAITPDSKLEKTVDGYTAVLSADSLKAGSESMLTFRISDAASAKPVDDLEPYLGAVGHVVIMSEDTEQYFHVHPMNESSTGPAAQFMTTFPKAGVYKIWGQFQHQGKVFVVPFVVKVS